MKRFIVLCTALMLAVVACGCSSESYPPTTATSTFSGLSESCTPRELSTKESSCADESSAVITQSTSEPQVITSQDTIVHRHDYQLVQVANPSCTEAGTRVFRCQCGAEYAEPIAMLEHDYTEISRKEPKQSVAGQITYRCTGCAATYNETIPALPACAETDMCGPSLIEKVLPHAPFPEEMQEIFALYHTHPQRYHGSQLAEDGYFYLSEDFTIADATETLLEPYRYFALAMPPYFMQHDDGNILWVFEDNERSAKQAEAYREAERIIQSLDIDDTVTQKDAILRINEYLCENNYYEYDTAKRPSTLHDAMFTTGNVCETYALEFQVLCLTAGIECHYYASIGMRHAWNRVYFSDGSYLWVDVTRNDSPSTEHRTRYLLIDDAQLWKDHTP